MTAQQIQQGKEEANIWLRKNREFIKNHPLKIISMTEEEIKIEKEKTEKFVKENNLDKPLQTNN